MNMTPPPLPKKKAAVFHHPLGFELYDGLAMDLHAMAYAEPLLKEIERMHADNEKLRRVLKAAVELVCAPAWAGVSDEDCELERVLRECGYVTPNA